ncbi:MAG TPA: LapA family protein [bacterium]|nr:LapA family protein [bacterium]
MGRTLLFLVILLVVVTVFALSNLSTVTVNFWQVTVYSGPLALVIVGAGVIGALLTYLGSLGHHFRLARQIRTLEGRVRAHEPLDPHPSASSLVTAPPPSNPLEETRRLP